MAVYRAFDFRPAKGCIPSIRDPWYFGVGPTAFAGVFFEEAFGCGHGVKIENWLMVQSRKDCWPGDQQRTEAIVITSEAKQTPQPNISVTSTLKHHHMERRSFLKHGSLLAGASLLLQKQALAEFFRQPAWKITMLRNDVGVFSERGGTIAFLLNKKGIAVVDSQFPEQSQHLVDELKKQSEKPFKYLINTHHHRDHSSGNISFKGIAEHVVGHENCLANMKRVAEKDKIEDKQLYPDITFSNTWKKKIGKEKIKAHYFGAAHTNGDAIIHFEHANIAHMGDLMFNRRHPVIDRTSGANIRNWTSVLQKTIDTFDNDTIFVFGHAFDPEKITGNKQDLAAFKNYLEKLLAFAEAEHKAGKTKEEFIKNTAIPGETEWKGDGISRALTAAYEEVSTPVPVK
ncbi:MAG: beta-lactamase protein [Chitinophagaceae bacterium]|jgi:glyoxylase-like metal-dependent hydrolase (beta-lactamase superfamily II)|nr:beta-lactamase protein [Chitinophagaceae bacterium]